LKDKHHGIYNGKSENINTALNSQYGFKIKAVNENFDIFKNKNITHNVALMSVKQRGYALFLYSKEYEN